ncbi:MAG TPA: transcriptional activator NhaR [Casimicrobiaceae bacterium]|nr:transcriptional activator NhaR [Casimicrobiaceae bacterium]
MSALNYKHLHYFWVVAKAGGVARAAERLHLTPQSISSQLKALEESLGGDLFRRVGRRLELTDAGRVALACADEIFPRGEQLRDMLRDRRGAMPEVLHVGIADVVPKSIAFRLLEPVLRLPEPMRIACREWRLRDLLAELAVRRLDVVIADAPMPAALDVRAFSHYLGTCGIAFFAAPALAGRLGNRFPRSLDDAPMLLPGQDAAVRPKLIQWFATQGIRPRVVGEFDDRALMQDFGQAGSGVFPAPAPLRDELGQRYGIKVLGETDEVVEEFYAISVERRPTARAVLAISDAARKGVFGPTAGAAPRRRAKRKARSHA